MRHHEELPCAEAVELLSAAADGEVTRHDRSRLDRHVEHCPGCAATADRFAELDRQLRFRPVETVPDLVPSITARVRPAMLGRGGWLRPALVWVALVLAAQNVTALLAGSAPGTADAHVARHIGAFGVALAIGFAYVAWRPHRAHGLLPFTAALVLTTSISAIASIADGGRSVLTESVHLTELAGLALVWMIAGSPGWAGVAGPRLIRRR